MRGIEMASLPCHLLHLLLCIEWEPSQKQRVHDQLERTAIFVSQECHGISQL